MTRSRVGLFLVLLAVLAWTARTTTTDTELIPKGATWRYFDGSPDPNGWRTLTFNDSSWQAGPAQLGYGDGDEATVISYGPNVNNKRITSYYRYTFTVPDPTLYQGLTLNILRDDGAVVYINGTEVFRTNMPSGRIISTTLAASAVSGADETTTFYQAAVSPSVLRAGTNVMAVEVHQSGATSTDVSFDAQLIGSTNLQLTRGPYLQIGTPSSVIVRWQTGASSDSSVMYGLSPSNLQWSATNGTVTSDHAITLTGLTPGTKYYYAVGSTTQTLAGDASHFFVTSPATGAAQPTRVWVLGDSGTADANARAVRDAFYGLNGGSTWANLWLMLGDNAYNAGTDAEFQAAVFNMYPATLRQSVLWPTLGNHDGTSADSQTGTGPYYNVFTLPKNGEAGGVPSGTEAYYSFDYGNIHFICLDSFDSSRAVGSPMLQWLAADLAANTQTWTVAFWHHPPYSKGSHDSDTDTIMTEMRANVLPVLEAGGVDLVLAGHSHSYERSYLLDGHYGPSSSLTSAMKRDAGNGREDGTGAYTKVASGPAPHLGAVYGVAGSSGQVGGGTLNHPAMFISLNVLGSMVLDLNGDRLDARFVDNTGATRDYFTIRKATGTAPAITTTTLPDATNGQAYSAPLVAAGGTLPYAWSVAAGALPAGLQLDPQTGVVAGLPTATGTSTFTARVTGADSQSATAPLAIRTASPVTISTSALPNGTIGSSYTQTLSAAGGLAPYTWSLVGGALPPGLTLAPGGLISGTVAAPVASYAFTVRATDAGSPPRTRNQSLSIAVVQLPAPGAFTKLAPAANAGGVGLPIVLSWAASTNTVSYQYCIDTTNDNRCGTGWVGAGTALTATVGGLARNTTYYWQARAANSRDYTQADAGTWWAVTTAP